MKRIAIGLLAAVFVTATGLSASAGAAAPQSDVTGVITENHMAVAGATVTAVCNGNTEVDATTDAFGSYLVVFPIAQCPFGSTVKVTAKKSGKSGVATGTVQGITTKLNLAIVNVSIPEFGLLGSLLAGSTGFGMISYMRRRRQSQQ